jgi:hypothetical protein
MGQHGRTQAVMTQAVIGPRGRVALRQRKRWAPPGLHRAAGSGSCRRSLRPTAARAGRPNGANDEFLLSATAQNLSRLARLRPMNTLPEMLAA